MGRTSIARMHRSSSFRIIEQTDRQYGPFLSVGPVNVLNTIRSVSKICSIIHIRDLIGHASEIDDTDVELRRNNVVQASPGTSTFTWQLQGETSKRRRAR
jgi:hypothetical protein